MAHSKSKYENSLIKNQIKGHGQLLYYNHASLRGCTRYVSNFFRQFELVRICSKNLNIRFCSISSFFHWHISMENCRSSFYDFYIFIKWSRSLKDSELLEGLIEVKHKSLKYTFSNKVFFWRKNNVFMSESSQNIYSVTE